MVVLIEILVHVYTLYSRCMYINLYSMVYLVKFDDVWVVQLFHYLHLTGNLLQILFV